MKKPELIDSIAEKAELSKAQAAKAVDAFLNTVKEELSSGTDKEVTVPGFGKFCVADRAAREGRVPSTGEKIQIPAKKVAQFKPGKELKDAVNNGA